MGFSANALRVLIASPGDVAEERTITTEEIHRWNDANAAARQLVLIPVKWETHSTPEMGNPPQMIINRQILNEADIVIAIFGTRIGTPTEEHMSGTVEEIKRHVAAGKTAKVYFSDVPIAPSAINEWQYASVQKFRQECQSTGLYATYNSLPQFRRDFSHHLDIELNHPRYRWLQAPEPSSITQDNKQKANFGEYQSAHTRELIDSLNYMQRDLLRLLLLKGGSARGDVISLASTNSAGAFDINQLCLLLIHNGLIARKEDPFEGHSTYTISAGITDVLQGLLIPRKEANDTPFFRGIPMAPN